jgi:hypothetical protein
MDQLTVCNQLEEAVEEQREELANIDVEALDGDSFKQQLKGSLRVEKALCA